VSILIRGGGVAAATCAHLLDADDFAVSWQTGAQGPTPPIMLSGAALSLMREVYGRPDLFGHCRPVKRRVVRWGAGEAVAVPHDGVVVLPHDLHGALGGQVVDGPETDPVLTIFAGQYVPDGNRLIFGRRTAFAARAAVDPDADGDCLVEALAAGWLFLLPAEAGKGWLLGFGGPLHQLLRHSSLIAPLVEVEDEDGAPFETAPHLTLPLAGWNWLACGTAALRFDPICGDGTAQAVREGVLAAAVIGAIAQGGDREALLTHYRSMLVASMRRHLDLCARFYASGGKGPWWRAQVAELARGHEVCTRFLAKMPEPRFVLRDFALEPRAEAA